MEMTYFENYNELKRKVNYNDDVIDLGSIEVHNFSFQSKMHDISPGADNYFCETHNAQFKTADPYFVDIGVTEESLNIPDADVENNKSFRYHIFKPKGVEKTKDIIIFLHGFNEKHWDKYLPWAKKITEDTQKTVVLFPIAFHMNRAPKEWVEKNHMYVLSEMRKKLFPNIVHSTLSNSAISVRLHSMPQRFIWSGLQSYYDIIQFVEQCKNGMHPIIDKNCGIDFFCYSIGGLLAEIIKMSNYKDYFSNSRLGMFCAGAVFNRLSPVSKFILDSEANVALYSYLVEHISSHIKKYDRLKHFFDPVHPEGYNLYAMLDYKLLRDYREEKFKKIEKQVLVVSLKNDTVVPAYEIMNTLQGAARDINIPIEVYDFPFAYSHENPFPVNKSIEGEVNEKFNMIFNRLSGFLK
jgi:hypothetical protein